MPHSALISHLLGSHHNRQHENHTGVHSLQRRQATQANRLSRLHRHTNHHIRRPINRFHNPTRSHARSRTQMRRHIINLTSIMTRTTTLSQIRKTTNSSRNLTINPVRRINKRNLNRKYQVKRQRSRQTLSVLIRLPRSLLNRDALRHQNARRSHKTRITCNLRRQSTTLKITFRVTRLHDQPDMKAIVVT